MGGSLKGELRRMGSNLANWVFRSPVKVGFTERANTRKVPRTAQLWNLPS
jgi:hypothetical protein